ncbi:response regulator [filamentous cyanobacterium LEGE 11480]|uniref:Response regulator n=1 Tax=Romeriopsis navalis LEGE 11480 TaxID=2777977 RepID=A0A928VPI0_9CYAN|nr:response regulator [Romeriopsis navalis]MBE9031377.1 response regulator [Romeriopsis navalis LEGE 11480]
MKSQLVNILLIEDDTVDSMDVQRAFKRSQTMNPLFVAKNTTSALAILRGEDSAQVMPNQRKLIILDIHLSGKSSWDFLETVAQDLELKKIPIIVLAADSQVQAKLEAKGYHATGYLQKPIKFEDLIEIMTKINQYWGICLIP